MQLRISIKSNDQSTERQSKGIQEVIQQKTGFTSKMKIKKRKAKSVKIERTGNGVRSIIHRGPGQGNPVTGSLLTPRKFGEKFGFGLVYME